MFALVRISLVLAAVYFGVNLGVSAGKTNTGLGVIVGLVATVLLFLLAAFISFGIGLTLGRYRAWRHFREYGR